MKLSLLILCFVILLPQASLGNEAVKDIYNQARDLIYSNPDSAKVLANKLYGMSVKSDNTYGLVRSQYLLGWISQHVDGNYGKGLIHHLEALRFSERGEYEQRQNDVLGVKQNLGYTYQIFGDRKTALRYFTECIDIARELDDNNLLLSSLRTLYLFYDDIEEYDEALNVIQEFERINSLVGNKTMLLDGLNTKGYVLKELKRYDEALRCYKDMLETIERFGKEQYLERYSLAITNSAECNYLLGNYSIAGKLYKESVAVKETIPHLQRSNPRSYFYSLQGIAEVDQRTNSYAKAEKSFKRTEDFLNSIPELSDDMYFEFYIKFANFYEQNGYFEKANSYRKIHSDKLAQHWKKQQEIELIDKQYNLELITQRYYSLLQQQERNERIQTYGAVSIITLVLIFAGVVLSGRVHQYRLKKDLEHSIRTIQES